MQNTVALSRLDPMKNCLGEAVIIGAGSSGYAMAAHLMSTGHRIRLWNRPGANHFKAIQDAGGIEVSGRIEGCFMPHMLTTSMRDALKDVRLILITVPAHAHLAVISEMCPYLVDGQILILNPGRTCGALEACQVLTQNKIQADVTVAETQTIVYTCRKTSAASCAILALKQAVDLASIPSDRVSTVIAALPDCLRAHFRPASSVLATGLNNVGMILHCAPVLLNAGWIETGRTPFKYYYEAITPSVADLLSRLDEERVSVAKACGCPHLSICDWFRQTYGIKADTLYECIQANTSYANIDAPKSLQHRYIYEDVSTGLVPIEAIGKSLGLTMQLTTLIIDLANALLHEDFRQIGRGLTSLRLQGRPKAEIISLLQGLRC